MQLYEWISCSVDSARCAIDVSASVFMNFELNSEHRLLPHSYSFIWQYPMLWRRVFFQLHKTVSEEHAISFCKVDNQQDLNLRIYYPGGLTIFLRLLPCSSAAQRMILVKDRLTRYHFHSWLLTSRSYDVDLLRLKHTPPC